MLIPIPIFIPFGIRLVHIRLSTLGIVSAAVATIACLYFQFVPTFDGKIITDKTACDGLQWNPNAHQACATAQLISWILPLPTLGMWICSILLRWTDSPTKK